jgi:hypothetical protein
MVSMSKVEWVNLYEQIMGGKDWNIVVYEEAISPS